MFCLIHISVILFKFTNKRDENLVKPLIANHDGTIVQTLFEFQEPVVKLVFKTSMHQTSPIYTGFQVSFSLADGCKYQVFLCISVYLVFI